MLMPVSWFLSQCPDSMGMDLCGSFPLISNSWSEFSLVKLNTSQKCLCPSSSSPTSLCRQMLDHKHIFQSVKVDVGSQNANMMCHFTFSQDSEYKQILNISCKCKDQNIIRFYFINNPRRGH